jgi:RNA polymerase sigma factor (sigma-70 family)
MNGRDQTASAHAALVDRARRGDETAWRALVTHHGPMLASIARQYRLGEADAADVVQTTWLRCLTSLHTVREPQALAGWLITTCRRECMHVIRQAVRVTPQDPTDAASALAAITDPGTGDGYAHVSRRDEVRRLYAAVGDLPYQQRRVLLDLMHHADEGYAAAAYRLGMPIGSLGPTRRRALDRLRQDARLAPTAGAGR